MKKKEKTEGKQILYEKYCMEHSPKEKTDTALQKTGNRRPVFKAVGNMAAIFILMAMVFLSAVGVVALLDPQMQGMLLSMVGL